MRRWTFDLNIDLTHGQPASYWARPVNTRRQPRRYHVDPLSRRREVAHGVLCSSPKPEQTLFFASERREIAIFGRLFSTHQPTTHLRSRYTIHPRSTRFVSGKASEYRWRPPKFHVEPWSRGREVAHDVLRSLPKPEKCLFFAIGDGSRFLSSGFYTPAPAQLNSA